MTLPHAHPRFWRKKIIMRIKITSRMSLKAQVIIVTIPISLEYLNYSEGFGPKLPLCYVLKHLWQVYNYYSFTYKYSFCCLQFSSDLGIQQGTPKFQHKFVGEWVRERERSIKNKEENSTWITTQQAKILQSCSHF